MKKFLFSKCKICVSLEQKSKAISLILKNNLSCIGTAVGPGRQLEIIIRQHHKDRFAKLFNENDIKAEYTEVTGCLKFIESIRGRYGLIFGFVFLILLMFYSSRVVWKIEINGLNTIERDDVINQLDKAGFSLGTYIPSIDYDVLHNNVLKNSKNLSWISVNIVGNVATVEIKEKISKNESIQPTYTNIVAKYDGYVDSIKVINGKRIVTKGSVVKKGDILISGIINSQAEGVRYEHADGQVMAFVNKSILVKVPFITTTKVYTGKKYTDKTYKIYNFPIKFLSKYGNHSSLYDKIEKKEKLCFLGISNIPIETHTTTYYEYEMKTVELSVSEAVDIAFVQLRNEMDAKLASAELIDKEIKTYYDSDSFYVECVLYCLEDIAEEQEIFVTN